jgi:hypothetical protein
MNDLIPGFFNDFYVVDRDTLSWTDLSRVSHGTLPSPRSQVAFTSAGENLYLHAGFSNAGMLT